MIRPFTVFTREVSPLSVILQVELNTLDELACRLARDIEAVGSPNRFELKDVPGIRAEANLLRELLSAYDITRSGLTPSAAQKVRDALACFTDAVEPVLRQMVSERPGYD